MIDYGFSGGRFAMQDFMKAEISQGKSLNPPLYLQEPLKYACNTEACPNCHNLQDEVASAERLVCSRGLCKDCTASMHHQEIAQCRNIYNIYMCVYKI